MKKSARPWGYFKVLLKEKNYCIKLLSVKPRQQLSLQKHLQREEYWTALTNCKVTLGRQKILLKKGNRIHIPKKAVHRLAALNKPAKVIEISFGKISEKDIIRLEDDYGRKKN